MFFIPLNILYSIKESITASKLAYTYQGYSRLSTLDIVISNISSCRKLNNEMHVVDGLRDRIQRYFPTNYISYTQQDNDHRIIMLSMQQVHSLNYWYPCLLWICFLDSLSMLDVYSSIHYFCSVSLSASSQPQGREYDITLIPMPLQESHRYGQCYLQQRNHDVGALFAAIV